MKVMQTDLHEEGSEPLLRGDARLHWETASARQSMPRQANRYFANKFLDFQARHLLGRKRKVGLNFWYAEDSISNRKYQEVRKINKDRPEKNNEGAPVGGL